MLLAGRAGLAAKNLARRGQRGVLRRSAARRRMSADAGSCLSRGVRPRWRGWSCARYHAADMHVGSTSALSREPPRSPHPPLIPPFGNATDRWGPPVTDRVSLRPNRLTNASADRLDTPPHHHIHPSHPRQGLNHLAKRARTREAVVRQPSRHSLAPFLPPFLSMRAFQADHEYRVRRA